MPYNPGFKSVHIKPVTGIMDLRSEPDMVPFGGYRFVENMITDEDGRLARLPGWTRSFASRTQNNWDLHDQLSADPGDPLSVDYLRQPITMLYEAVTPANFSKLFAATQNRIYALNNETGNWKIISDQLGGTYENVCSDKRWKAAHVGMTVLFTNGEDNIIQHAVDQPAMEAGDQSVSTIPDLVTLEIRKAKVIVAWNNMILLMNIEQEGVWHPNRILWSDYRRPTAFVPATASLAGYQDLDDSDVIVGACAMKNVLLIYTSKGIWQLQVSGSETTFSVSQRWKAGHGGKRTLAYPNTLVSTGENHYYFGFDGIYRYGMFDQEPEQVSWIHKGTKRIFEDIEKERCGMAVGGFQSDKNLIWWSWGASGESCPTQTFVVNVTNQFSAYVDHGFTAFLHHEPDSNKTLMTWILEMCICTPEDLQANDFWFTKEGGYCTSAPTYTCATTPASFYSQNSKVDGDITSEDWTGDADADSLYSILGDTTVSELCGSEFREDDCNAERLFLMASASDYCLKEASTIFYRESCIDFSRGGCGQYGRTGYRSRLLSGPNDLKFPDDDKIINRFAVEQHSQPESIPAQISLNIGAASHAVDPMADGGRCVILWDALEDRNLACLSDVDAETHEEDGTRPNDELEWPLYHMGRFLYFDIVIKNDDSSPVDTGGAVSFSRFTFDAVANPRS